MPVTREHVWPSWISKVLQEYGPFSLRALDLPERVTPEFDTKVKRVCTHGRMTVFRVLFEIAHFNPGVEPVLPGAIAWEDFAIRIWPPTGEARMWPENRLAFRADSLDAMRVTDRLPPEALDRYRSSAGAALREPPDG